MFNLFKKKQGQQLVAPINGQLIPLDEVSDEVFSTRVMGDGFAVAPSSDVVVSPVSGTITNIFPTKHAISITTQDGLEILLHLGIDTVELNGTPFTVVVESGQTVSAGDELVRMDREEISNSNKEDTVILVLPGKEKIDFTPSISSKEIEAGEMVTELK